MRLPIAILLLAAALSGCLPIPLPGWRVGEIADESIAAINPGLTTRADVLLVLGDPETRGESDRHFVYSWSRFRGGVAFATAGAVVGMTNARSCHRLAIKFAPDGVVAKVRAFHGKAQLETATMADPMDRPVRPICDIDTELPKLIEEWLAELPTPSQ